MFRDVPVVEATPRTTADLQLLLENLDSAGDAAKSLRERGGGGMHCRHCKMNDHFSVNCPYKDFLGVLEDDDANGPPPPSGMRTR